jgi:hypothetical protein
MDQESFEEEDEESIEMQFNTSQEEDEFLSREAHTNVPVR